MTLLLSVIAAITVTIIWYSSKKARDMHCGFMALMFWGASLMWFVDAIFEYVELGVAYFSPAIEDMVNDAFLGVCVIALGLIIWLVVVLVKDSDGVIRGMLQKKN